MPQVKEKKKSKNKGKKIVTIIISVIVAIAIIAAVFITVVTKPKDENDKKVVYVGGMVTSESIDYQSDSAEGIKNNPVIKIMEMIWYFCDGGDKKNHESQTPPENVKEIADIPYVDDGNHYHMLDVMYPSNVKEGDKLPVIIDIHGGGWMYADKDLNDYYCMSLADRGYVVFNVSYRLVPDVTVNEQIQDCALALKWISDHMADYPCDPSNIMLTGDSAGGQLSAYSTVIMQSPELQKTFDTVNPNMDITALVLTSPVAFMKDGGAFSIYTKLLWGKDYKTKATYDYMDLDKIIDYAKDMPPVYLITSSGDSLAHDQTVRAYELFKEKGIKCELADYDKQAFGEDKPHVYSVLNPFDEAGKTTIDSAIDFYKQAMQAK